MADIISDYGNLVPKPTPPTLAQIAKEAEAKTKANKSSTTSKLGNNFYAIVTNLNIACGSDVANNVYFSFSDNIRKDSKIYNSSGNGEGTFGVEGFGHEFNSLLLQIKPSLGTGPIGILNKKAEAYITRGTAHKNPMVTLSLMRQYDAKYVGILSTASVGDNFLYRPLYEKNAESFCSVVAQASTANNNASVPAMYVPVNNPPSLATEQAWQKDSNINGFLSYLADRSFGCSLFYPGYVTNTPNNLIKLDFSKAITSQQISQILGLALYVGKGKLVADNVDLIRQLIAIYSNVRLTGTLISPTEVSKVIGDKASEALSSANPNSLFYNSRISASENANKNYINFSNTLISMVGRFEQSTSAEVRTSNVLKKGETSGPQIVDTEEEKSHLVLINNDNLSPSGLSINQFTQPAFDEIISILDIVRDETNYPVKDENPIVVEAPDISTLTSSDDTTCSAIVFNNLGYADKMNALTAIKAKIAEAEASLDRLQVHDNKMAFNLQTQLATIVYGIGGAAGTAWDQAVSAGEGGYNQAKETSKAAWGGFKKSVAGSYDSAKSQLEGLGDTAEATWKDATTLGEKFKADVLGAVGSIHPISDDALNKIKDELKKRGLENCDTLQTLTAVTNKGNTAEVTKKIDEITKKREQYAKEIEKRTNESQKEITKLKELLSKIG